MPTTGTKTAAKRPVIHISEADYDRIADMALRIEHSAPALSKLILDEIDRAHVHSNGRLPKNVVALNSEVEFLDTTTSTRRRVKLVMPTDADIAESRISIMTPVGAGLIGMSAGREINWPCPDGRPRVLKILEVKQEP
jgi:regulator of nucleoside diphosphate kinase